MDELLFIGGPWDGRVGRVVCPAPVTGMIHVPTPVAGDTFDLHAYRVQQYTIQHPITGHTRIIRAAVDGGTDHDKALDAVLHHITGVAQ